MRFIGILQLSLIHIFDFTLKNHYHVKCVNCGEVSDVDMDEIPDLMKKIHDTHGIEFLDYDISFKGICSKCREDAEMAS